MIGSYEEKLLLAILKDGNKAYGAGIMRTLEEWDGSANIGAIYSTLARLEKKGFIETWTGEPENKRGGKRKKYNKVIGSGRAALEEVEAYRQRIRSFAGVVEVRNGNHQ